MPTLSEAHDDGRRAAITVGSGSDGVGTVARSGSAGPRLHGAGDQGSGTGLPERAGSCERGSAGREAGQAALGAIGRELTDEDASELVEIVMDFGEQKLLHHTAGAAFHFGRLMCFLYGPQHV